MFCMEAYRKSLLNTKSLCISALPSILMLSGLMIKIKLRLKDNEAIQES